MADPWCNPDDGCVTLARMAPEPLQNQMFGPYAFSGKATAFLGPLLVGWVTSWADSQRIGMSVIIGFFCLGFILLWRAPVAGRTSHQP